MRKRWTGATAIMVALILNGLGTGESALAVTMCVGTLTPDGMVITEAGSDSICPGTCTAREVQPVQGLVMVICAGQAIPPGYVLSHTETIGACSCVGQRDNAYLITQTAEASEYGWRSDLKRSPLAAPQGSPTPFAR